MTAQHDRPRPADTPPTGLGAADSPPTDLGSADAASRPAGDRESAVVDAFVEIVDAMSSGVDVGEMLSRLVQRCTDLLGGRSAAILLPDPDGLLVTVTCSSSEQAALEHFALQAHEGPCLDCVSDEAVVAVDDLDEQADRWPDWSARARADAVRSVYAFPLHVRGGTAGVLNILGNRTALMTESDLHLAGALARVVAAVLTANQDSTHSALLTTQLQNALSSRIVIEQAKGVVATSLGTSMDDAFAVIRHHCRTTHQQLAHVAAKLTTGQLGAENLRPPRRPTPPS